MADETKTNKPETAATGGEDNKKTAAAETAAAETGDKDTKAKARAKLAAKSKPAAKTGDDDKAKAKAKPAAAKTKTTKAKTATAQTGDDAKAKPKAKPRATKKASETKAAKTASKPEEQTETAEDNKVQVAAEGADATATATATATTETETTNKKPAAKKSKGGKEEDVRFYGTGRRKEATARVFLRPGDGGFIVNKKPIESFFPRARSQMVAKQALKVMSEHGESGFDVYATVVGGGESGQAEAVRHGISRAMVAYRPDCKPILRAAGFISRDARAVERKKVGLRKARRARQYSKR